MADEGFGWKRHSDGQAHQPTPTTSVRGYGFIMRDRPLRQLLMRTPRRPQKGLSDPAFRTKNSQERPQAGPVPQTSTKAREGNPQIDPTPPLAGPPQFQPKRRPLANIAGRFEKGQNGLEDNQHGGPLQAEWVASTLGRPVSSRIGASATARPCPPATSFSPAPDCLRAAGELGKEGGQSPPSRLGCRRDRRRTATPAPRPCRWPMPPR